MAPCERTRGADLSDAIDAELWVRLRRRGQAVGLVVLSQQTPKFRLQLPQSCVHVG